MNRNLIENKMLKKTLIFDNGAHTLKIGHGKQDVKLVKNQFTTI